VTQNIPLNFQNNRSHFEIHGSWPVRAPLPPFFKFIESICCNISNFRSWQALSESEVFPLFTYPLWHLSQNNAIFSYSNIFHASRTLCFMVISTSYVIPNQIDVLRCSYIFLKQFIPPSGGPWDLQMVVPQKSLNPIATGKAFLIVNVTNQPWLLSKQIDEIMRRHIQQRQQWNM